MFQRTIEMSLKHQHTPLRKSQQKFINWQHYVYRHDSLPFSYFHFRNSVDVFKVLQCFSEGVTCLSREQKGVIVSKCCHKRKVKIKKNRSELIRGSHGTFGTPFTVGEINLAVLCNLPQKFHPWNKIPGSFFFAVAKYSILFTSLFCFEWLLSLQGQSRLMAYLLVLFMSHIFAFPFTLVL